MNGYLQRIVAGAANPQPRLRPFAGSIFEDEHRRARDADPATDEIAVVPRFEQTAREETVAPESARNPARDRRSTVADRMEAPASRTGLAALEPIAAFEPLMRPAYPPAPGRDTADGDVPGASARESTELDLLEPPQRRPNDSATQGSGVNNTQRVDRASSAIVTTTAQAEIRLRPAIAPPTDAVSARANDTRTARAATARAADTGSNDVQIHIGRIDVVAAPPPSAPRAPKTPARKAMSLDDYLAHRNGRRR